MLAECRRRLGLVIVVASTFVACGGTKRAIIDAGAGDTSSPDLGPSGDLWPDHASGADDAADDTRVAVGDGPEGSGTPNDTAADAVARDVVADSSVPLSCTKTVGTTTTAGTLALGRVPLPRTGRHPNSVMGAIYGHVLSRPSASICCCRSSPKTLAIPAQDHDPVAFVNVPAARLGLAGFQVSTAGRFWVSPEAAEQ